ncbi:signal recognition particle-docking protein FtsY [Alteromonas sp. RW2A1]|uniref:signal recognition particle-docking protein FtsY n=1 Tax=Alteromonas sp. RW2A1 TaxID=1917158 RepID=UPI0009038CD3|nr:signal recognition particle-docking protein FtsY [Alteromonas sp. RW2A1]APE07154.1 signal recognition particle-docking protein FtsY [Alteromonas sp. RW2A1]
MSKLFGWFSKNKKAEKQKEQQAKEHSAEEAAVSAEKSASEETATAPQQKEEVPSLASETTDGNEAIRDTIVDAVESTAEDANNNDSALTAAPESISESDFVEATAEPAENDDAAKSQAPLDFSSADDDASESINQAVDSEQKLADKSQAQPPSSNPPTVEEASTASVEDEFTVTNTGVENTGAEDTVAEDTVAEEPQPVKEKKSLFARLKESLSRTKKNIGSGIVSLFKGKVIDDELYEDLETQLLVADVGMDTTQKIINHLTESASRKDLKDAEALLDILKQQMSGMLANVNEPLNDVLQKHNAEEGPFVILMVGVNGVGKTTTIGKLAKQFQQQGKKVMLAAGDTFRAAAVEQLQVWGERNSIPVIAQHTGADSASVLYDALEAAKSRGSDILIADTAGRLQNKDNLMEELKKVVRVMKKLNPNAPHEVMLTLDAGTGQNAISQAKLFNEAVGLTGITLTKLDGTAKGGVIFSVADQFGIPIRYIGVGEGIDDLRQFDGEEFIDALFSELDTPAS